MTEKITATLKSMTLGQLARRLSNKTREPEDEVLRAVIQAAHEGCSPDLDDSEIDLALMQELQKAEGEGLSASKAEERVDRLEEDLLKDWPGLYVRDCKRGITPDTPASRAAICAWLRRNGIDPRSIGIEAPRPSTAGDEAHARRLLEEMVSEAPNGAKPFSKEKCFKTLQAKIPNLSRKAFERLWDKTVPKGWKNPGRPRKSLRR